MAKQSTNTKRGFTIIEVVLVLAIGGLIFMMVFIALPALQRSQRDTQRNNDISRFVSQLTNYQSNNRGKIPGTAEGTVGAKYDETAEAKNGILTIASSEVAAWKKFYDNYLLAGGDTFEDPSGAPYQLAIVDCGVKKGTCSSGQRDEAEFEDEYEEGTTGDSTAQNYTISVVIHATCDGEQATYSAGARKVAVLYKKEGGGVVCEAN